MHSLGFATHFPAEPKPEGTMKEKSDRLLESVSDGWVQVIKDIYKFHQPDAWKDWHPLQQLPPSI
jgi:hypothetical protein